jgi:hypothetical protein
MNQKLILENWRRFLKEELTTTQPSVSTTANVIDNSQQQEEEKIVSVTAAINSSIETALKSQEEVIKTIPNKQAVKDAIKNLIDKIQLREEKNNKSADTQQLDVRNPNSILPLMKKYSKMSSGSPGPDEITKQNLAKDETKKLIASLPSTKTNPTQAATSLFNMLNFIFSEEDKAEIVQALERLQQAASQTTSQFKENQQVGAKAYLMLHNALNKLGDGSEEKGIAKVANGALIAGMAAAMFAYFSNDMNGLATIMAGMPKLISSSKSSDIFQIIGAGAEVVTEAKKKKKKKSGDRCTRIAKRKYDVWPSAYASGAVVRCRQGKIWKGVSENMSDQEIDDALLLEEIEVLEEAKKKAYKPNFSKEKEQGLHGWFARNDGKGWVNCRTGGPCGRDNADKGGKYPACRPTKAQCKSAGKGPLRKKKSSSPISWTKKKKD